MAVAVAQPTDVVKVRFQAQARTEGAKRYQGTLAAYKTIAREEGLRGLWKGWFRWHSTGDAAVLIVAQNRTIAVARAEAFHILGLQFFTPPANQVPLDYRRLHLTVYIPSTCSAFVGLTPFSPPALPPPPPTW